MDSPLAPRRASTRTLLLLAVGLAASGCATARPIAPIDTSSSHYRSAELDDTALQHAGLAVLPVTHAGTAAFDLQRTGNELREAIERRQICAAVIGPTEVRERFAREAVLDDFERLIAELPRTASLDRVTLDSMARATGCRYFLQASIRGETSADRASVNGRPHTSHAVTTDLHAQIWDAASGEVVWEGVGGGAALTTSPHHGSLRQTREIAVRGLARCVGNDPSWDPASRHVAQLHEMDHAQAAEVEGQNMEALDAVATGLEVFVAMLQVAGAIAEIVD